MAHPRRRRSGHLAHQPGVPRDQRAINAEPSGAEARWPQLDVIDWRPSRMRRTSAAMPASTCHRFGARRRWPISPPARSIAGEPRSCRRRAHGRAPSCATRRRAAPGGRGRRDRGGRRHWRAGAVSRFGFDGSFRGAFNAYDPGFRGGVRVAVCDVDGDGTTFEIVTGAGPGGGPHVRVFRPNGAAIGGFMGLRPGVHRWGLGGMRRRRRRRQGRHRHRSRPRRRTRCPGAAARWRGDRRAGALRRGLRRRRPRRGVRPRRRSGRAEVVTAAGPGGGPHVHAFRVADRAVIGGFMAYDPAFAGGVRVACGDLNADGAAEIITGPGEPGGPHVRIVDRNGVDRRPSFIAIDTRHQRRPRRCRLRPPRHDPRLPRPPLAHPGLTQPQTIELGAVIRK